MIKVGSDCSGVGAFIQALQRLNIDFKESFSCDYDFYARQTYLLNYGTKADYELSKSKEHKKHSDKVKAIVLGNLVSNDEEKILNDANEFSKNFSFYFPFNMYQREIPKEPLDIYISTVPCQSFSLAGKRKGENDKRGILFYNSHEFIKKNKPRYFIFENVKGLLSDDKTDKKSNYGRTFGKWLDYLGGKSVNGVPVIFPHEESVPYHIYYKVLNAKDYGVPQNRERVFIVGVRDDVDNIFSWAKPIPLTLRLKDLLDDVVDDKYYLSERLINSFITRPQSINYPFNPLTEEASHIPCLTARYFKSGATDPYIKVKSATKKGYEKATINDSINISNPNSETRRGRVGKSVPQTLETQCNQAVLVQGEIVTDNDSIDMKSINNENRGNVVMKNMARTLDHNCAQAVIQLNPSNESGGQQPYKQNRIYDANGISPVLDTECGRPAYLQKLGSLYENDSDAGRIYSTNGISCTIKSEGGGAGAKTGLYNVGYRVRKLTPKECFRLMDFNSNFKWSVSDTQAYKQAGNSIVVACLIAIISKLNLK